MAKRILIVEDYPALATVSSQLAAMEGYDVCVVASGEEAIRMLDSYDPDLVLLDLMLSGPLSGEDVLRTARSTGSRAKVLVVSAMVGHGGGGLGELADVEVLPKPFKVRELSARIGAMLQSTPAARP